MKRYIIIYALALLLFYYQLIALPPELMQATKSIAANLKIRDNFPKITKKTYDELLKKFKALQYSIKNPITVLLIDGQTGFIKNKSYK